MDSIEKAPHSQRLQECQGAIAVMGQIPTLTAATNFSSSQEFMLLHSIGS